MQKKNRAKLKINIILPFFLDTAGGGIKVMYEYAAGLADLGHDIVIYHPDKVSYTTHEKKSNLSFLIRMLRRKLTFRYPNRRPTWYSLSDKITCKTIPYIDNLFIRNADVSLTTWWGTVYDVVPLSAKKGEKFYLIQGHETLLTTYPENLVYETYTMPIHKIVISDFLYNIVSSITTNHIDIIPNGIDLDRYKILQPIKDRNSQSIVMRYATQSVKGCDSAIEAFDKLKQEYPDLRVVCYSSEVKPDNFPLWIDYIYGENNITPLYNEAAIFILPSVEEGWALPPMEAMACGCACVCTDIGISYLKNGDNCLLTKPNDVDGLKNCISELIRNIELRHRIASQGRPSIVKYQWGTSFEKMETVFYNVLSDTK